MCGCVPSIVNEEIALGNSWTASAGVCRLFNSKQLALRIGTWLYISYPLLCVALLE